MLSQPSPDLTRSPIRPLRQLPCGLTLYSGHVQRNSARTIFSHHLNWNVKVVADGIYFLTSFLNDFKRTKNAIERLLSGNDVSYCLPPTIPIKFLTENAFCQVFKTTLQSVGWAHHLTSDAHCNVFHPLT